MAGRRCETQRRDLSPRYLDGRMVQWHSPCSEATNSRKAEWPNVRRNGCSRAAHDKGRHRLYVLVSLAGRIRYRTSLDDKASRAEDRPRRLPTPAWNPMFFPRPTGASTSPRAIPLHVGPRIATNRIEPSSRRNPRRPPWVTGETAMTPVLIV